MQLQIHSLISESNLGQWHLLVMMSWITIHVVYQNYTAISSQISKEDHLSRIKLFSKASQLNFVWVNYEMSLFIW